MKKILMMTFFLLSSLNVFSAEPKDQIQVITQEQIEISEATNLLIQYLNGPEQTEKQTLKAAHLVLEKLIAKRTLLQSIGGAFKKTQVIEISQITKRISKAYFSLSHQDLTTAGGLQNETYQFKLSILKKALFERRDTAEIRSNAAFAIGGLLISGVFFGHMLQVNTFVTPNSFFSWLGNEAIGFLLTFHPRIILVHSVALAASQMISIGLNTYIDEDLNLDVERE